MPGIAPAFQPSKPGPERFITKSSWLIQAQAAQFRGSQPRAMGMVCTELATQLALMCGRDRMIRWAEAAAAVIRTTPPLMYTVEADMFLRNAVWFIRSGRRHPHMDDDSWFAMRRVAERLVASRDLDRSALRLFEASRA